MTSLTPEILAALEKQAIELPSWAFGNSGTRFKVFGSPGTPRTPYEKVADAAQVHRLTGLAPAVAQDRLVIAGRDAVVLIEGHNTRAGGAWLAGAAKELTGRWPAHVIVTHCHGDHVNGVCGCLHPEHETQVIGSAGTRTLIAERAASSKDWKFDDATKRADLGALQVIPEIVIADDAGSTELDLGGRTITIETRAGHTPSDMTVRVEDPRIVWTGDLVFNHLFPYFGDAIPTKLLANCTAMLRDPDTAYVPGHGSIATAADLVSYLGLLENLEAAARDAHAKGIPADEAWKTYEIPASLGEWRKFREDVYRFGFEAWERELTGA